MVFEVLLIVFGCCHLNPLLEKLAKEQKTVILVAILGDFNVDLLKYEQHKATNKFLDSLSFNMFLPCIIQDYIFRTISVRV